MAGLDWRRIHKEATIVDLHIHPSMQQQLFSRNLSLRYVMKRTLRSSPLQVRASFPRLADGGYDVILSTIHIPEKGIIKDFRLINLFRILRPDLWHKIIAAQPYDATIRVMGDMEDAVTKTSGYGWSQMACSLSELEAILAKPQGERPIAIVHCVEGGHSLGGKTASEAGVLNNLDSLFQRGVAYLTLAHFYPNQIVNPCYPFPEDIVKLASRTRIWRDLTLGLTDFGKQVVQRMMDMGMLIDISHCTPTARKEIYDIADAFGKRVPLLATHVGAYEINPSPYNLANWEIRRIARDGGAIGVIFMPYWLMPKESKHGINFISRHIHHLVSVGGEDVVGIGTDFDGFTTPPEDLDSASKMPRLTQRLVVDGYNETQIKKILGGNALRVLREGWGRK
jgi:microsomal dipeptidase-like Zn-dependent dipeptidase